MRRTLLLAGLLFGCIGTACAGQIYKWVDAQGVTHFTAQPPQTAAATVVPSARQPLVAPATASAKAITADDPKQAEIDARVRDEVAQKEKERTEHCSTLRSNLAQYRHNPRVSAQINGETRLLTQEERHTRTTETESAIAKYCD